MGTVSNLEVIATGGAESANHVLRGCPRQFSHSAFMLVISRRVAIFASGALSTTALRPFNVGMPEVCVDWSNSILAQAPYGTKAMCLWGTCLEMAALTTTWPNPVVTRTFSPSFAPSSFMSSGSSSQTATDRAYSSENFPRSRLCA